MQHLIKPAFLGAIACMIIVTLLVVTVEGILGEEYLPKSHVSYGQAFAFLTLPICAIVGCCVGVFLSSRNRPGVAFYICFFLCLVCLTFAISMWRSEKSTQTSDLSQYMTLIPVISLSTCGMLIAIGVLISWVLWKQVKEESGTLRSTVHSSSEVDAAEDKPEE